MSSAANFKTFSACLYLNIYTFLSQRSGYISSTSFPIFKLARRKMESDDDCISWTSTDMVPTSSETSNESSTSASWMETNFSFTAKKLSWVLSFINYGLLITTYATLVWLYTRDHIKNPEIVKSDDQIDGSLVLILLNL